MKKYIKNWMRFLILGITILITILVISFGSIFYVSKEPKLSIEYGGGYEVVVKVTDNKGETPDQKTTKQVINALSNKINSTGLNSVKLAIEGTNQVRVTISKSGKDDKAVNERDKLSLTEKLITTKPILSLYGLDDKPIFISGKFNIDRKLPNEYEDDYAPILANSAKAVNQSGGNVVSMTLKNDAAQQEWTKATTWMSKQKKGQNKIIVWLNHGIQSWKDSDNPAKKAAYETSLLQFANSKNYHKSLYNYVYVDNSPITTNGNTGKPMASIFKKFGLPFGGGSYMISDAAVDKPLNGKSFVIQGHFNFKEAQELATNINFGSADYQLVKVSSHFVDASYGISAFQKAVIAGLIVFSLISIFMIVNYGLLGALSTISIALYMFLTLLMFTIMRGEYSPETIAALVIGIGMSVDANIITFERLKAEIYRGNSIKKSVRMANKMSLSTIFDANITTLIVGFVLFYFGTAGIRGFSVMLIISIVFTLIIILLFTRILSGVLVRTGIFQNRLGLAGIHRKYIEKDNSNSKIKNFNYMKHSKWFVIGSLTILGGGAAMFATQAIARKDISKGANTSIDFSGGTIVDISTGSSEGDTQLTKDQANGIKKILIDKDHIKTDDISIIYQKGDKAKEIQDGYILKISTKKAINPDVIKKQITEKYAELDNINVLGNTVSTYVADHLTKQAIIAVLIAMAAIVLYTLFRFRWTFSIASIIALVHDGLIVTAVFILVRAEISPIFIAGVLSVLGYSINDTIVTFDRVREKMKLNNEKLSKERLIKIANEAIRDTIKRSILTVATTLGAVLVLMVFHGATKFSFNLAMLIGLVSGTYSSIFIATYVWVLLEVRHLKRKEKRIANGFWNVEGPEEQTIPGINDFKI